MPNFSRRKFLRGAGTVMASTARGFPARGIPFAPLGPEPPSNAQPPQGSRAIRGVMVDAARVPETLNYYRRVIAFCAEWKLNTVHFRLTDDQGSAMRFTSVPDLVNHRHAFSPNDLSELNHFASSHGVDLIPEIESFGHTGYVTRSPRYRHLLDAESGNEEEFTGVIPVKDETLQLFAKLYREIAEVFPSPYLHGGCDEVNWGGSAASRQALRSKSRAQIWAEYLNHLGQIAEGLGKQFIVWGDFVLQKEPDVLARLNTRTIIMDWNYWDSDPEKFSDSLKKIESHGARSIGAPGLISYRWGARAGASQLANIDAFAKVYIETETPASLGVILTNWVPSRYVQNSIWDGFAYAGVAFSEGSVAARTSAFRRFAEHHYQASWSEDWKDVFQLIYDAAPGFGEHAPSGLALPMPIPWSTDAELRASIQKPSLGLNPFPHIRQLLSAVEKSVRSNRADFDAFVLAIEYLDEVFWRESAIRDAGKKALVSSDAHTLIREIAERDRIIVGLLSADWNAGRFADSPSKTEPLFGMQPKDQLFYQFSRATAYSNSLAERADHFFEILRQFGRASLLK